MARRPAPGIQFGAERAGPRRAHRGGAGAPLLPATSAHIKPGRSTVYGPPGAQDQPGSPCGALEHAVAAAPVSNFTFAAPRKSPYSRRRAIRCKKCYGRTGKSLTRSFGAIRTLVLVYRQLTPAITSCGISCTLRGSAERLLIYLLLRLGKRLDTSLAPMESSGRHYRQAHARKAYGTGPKRNS